MRVSVARRYVFEARHHLEAAPSPWCYDHPHHYTVEIVCEGMTTDGMVVDTDDLDDAWACISHRFAGCNLNDTLPVVTTSVEDIAAWVLDQFPQASSVTVWEDRARWGRVER